METGVRLLFLEKLVLGGSYWSSGAIMGEAPECQASGRGGECVHRAEYQIQERHLLSGEIKWLSASTVGKGVVKYAWAASPGL